MTAEENRSIIRKERNDRKMKNKKGKLGLIIAILILIILIALGGYWIFKSSNPKNVFISQINKTIDNYKGISTKTQDKKINTTLKLSGNIETENEETKQRRQKPKMAYSREQFSCRVTERQQYQVDNRPRDSWNNQPLELIENEGFPIPVTTIINIYIYI